LHCRMRIGKRSAVSILVLRTSGHIRTYRDMHVGVPFHAFVVTSVSVRCVY
jgi:hypothetical protein